jgi:diacylglycerol kinase family enzyme
VIAQDGIEYSVDGELYRVEPSSIICATTADQTRTIFFLREATLFSIESDGLGSKFDGLQSKLARDDFDGHIIVSVKSGNCLAEPFFKRVITPLLTHFSLTKHYNVHKTTSNTSITELTKSILLPTARQGRKQHILLLSGDGGIVDIVNELFTTGGLLEGFQPPVISLIPMGTGNALAHSTKIFEGTNGLASWLRGQPKDLPLIRATFSNNHGGAKLLSDEGRKQEDLPVRSASESRFWGAVVFSWGFHAQIVADSDTPEFREHGAKRFQMAAQEALFPADGSGPHKYHGLLTVQTREDSHSIKWSKLGNNEHVYVLGTLVSNLEETFTISPHSTPFSGKLRLVHIGHDSGEEVMRIMGLAYQHGKHIEDKKVDYKEVAGFALQFEEEEEKWRRVCIDGKIILVEKGGSVEVQREKQIVVQLSSVV